MYNQDDDNHYLYEAIAFFIIGLIGLLTLIVWANL